MKHSLVCFLFLASIQMHGQFCLNPNFLVAAPLSNDIITGDLDNDGNSDLIELTQGNGFFYAHGNGDGSFSSFQPVILSAPPDDAALADFNMDGAMDLVCIHGTQSISFVPGNGSGGFSTPTGFYYPGASSSITTGDYNGDGFPDIATANPAFGYTISVYTGNGDGSFDAQVDYETASFAEQIETADFNNDGHDDLIVSHDNIMSLSLMEGSASGIFNSYISIATPIIAQDFVCADFNNDDLTDIACVGNNTLPAASVVLINADSFTFGAGISVEMSGNYITAGDLNADGNNDLIFLSTTFVLGQNLIQCLLNNGAGDFSGSFSYPASLVPSNMIAADFNNDGKSDLAIPNLAEAFGDNILLVTTGSSISDVDLEINNESCYGSNDASVEVIVSGENAPFHYTWINLDAPDQSSVENLPSGYYRVLVSDNDGCGLQLSFSISAVSELDAMLVNSNTTCGSELQNNGHVLVHGGTAPYTYSWMPAASDDDTAENITPGYYEVSITDANGCTENISAIFGFHIAQFSTETAGIANMTHSFVGSMDIENDGDQDVIITNEDDNFSLMINNGSGSFATQQLIDLEFSNIEQDVTFADMNNDGYDDMVYPDNNYVVVLLNNGNGSFGDEQSYQIDYGLNAMTTADFDNDGDIDVATSTYLMEIQLCKNNSGDISAVSSLDVEAIIISMQTGDFDEDGSTDLICAGGNYIYLFTNDGSGNMSQSDLTYGSDVRDLVTGDFNEDGHLDVAYVETFHRITVRYGNGDGTLSVPQTIAAVDLVYRMQAGDLDQDGLTDFLFTTYYDEAYALMAIGATSYSCPQLLSSDINHNFIHSMHINQDGKSDLVLLSGDNLVHYMTSCSLVKAESLPKIGSTQIFPIPAADKLSVRTTEPWIREVRIHDIQGREIRRIFIGEQSAFEINLEGLSEGSYTLELMSEDRREVSMWVKAR